MISEENIALSMAEADSLEEAWNLLIQAMKMVGFDRLVYGYNGLPHSDSALGDINDAIVLSNHDPKYIELFVGREMYRNGPMVRWALENGGACSWSEISKITEGRDLSSDEIAVMEINKRFGVTAGYTIAFHNSAGRACAGIGLAAETGLSQDDIDNIWSAHQKHIKLCNHIFHMQVCRLPHFTTNLRRLKKRQHDVLRCTAMGQSPEQIASELNVSVSTVKRNLDGAKRALNTTSIEHAVFIITTANQITNIERESWPIKSSDLNKRGSFAW
ncbi:MAG: LuxR family transcriptional regulator [Pseudoruegeria sp.]